MHFQPVSAISVQKKSPSCLGNFVVYFGIRSLVSVPLRVADGIASGKEGEALADEFTRLSSKLHNTIYPQDLDQHDSLCGLNGGLQSAITNIRKPLGLARFLLPSTFCELQHAASAGPAAILNASQYACYALAVFVSFFFFPTEIPFTSHFRSPHPVFMNCRQSSKPNEWIWGRSLARFLRTLWDEVKFPIADFLQATSSPGSRIW